MCFRIHQKQDCTLAIPKEISYPIFELDVNMRGYDILHPMDWDAFGLLASQYAIKMGINWATNTANNIAIFKTNEANWICDRLE
jgi:hypothetical protein